MRRFGRTTRRGRRIPQRRRPLVETLEARHLLAVVQWSGTLPDGSVWRGGDIHHLTGDVRVPAATTLTIEPGAIVKAGTFAVDLRVEGTLTAQGTAAMPIVWTEIRDDMGGDTNGDADASSPGPGGWGNLLVSSTGQATVSHTEFRYGGFGNPAQLTVDSGSLSLANVSLVSSISDGLRIQKASPALDSIHFAGNRGAAASMDLASNPAITGVTMAGNAINGLQVDAGIIQQDAAWDDPDITYWLDGDITVAADKTLTVGAGQVVKFSVFNADLIVRGTLKAGGTAAAPIVMTESRDDTAGGDTNNDGSATAPARGNWGFVSLEGPGNEVHHTEFRYGGFGRPAQLTVDGGELVMSHGSSTQSLGDGLRIQRSDPDVSSMTLTGNGRAAASMDLASNPAMSGLTLGGNAVNGLIVDGGRIQQDAFWDDPEIPYWLAGDITVDAGHTLTIGAGQVVKFGTFGVDLFVAGTLVAEGTAEAPIILTESRDDTAGGDTNGDGGASVPSRGNWGAVLLSGPGSRMRHAQLRYGGFGRPAHLVVDGGGLTLENSASTNSVSDGLRIQNADPVLTSNRFLANAGEAVSMDLASNPSIAGVTVSGNGVNGLALDGGTISGPAFWDDADIPYWLTGDVTVGAGQTLTVGPGQVVKFGTFGVDLFVAGTLVAEGTAEAPIILTESRDDTAGGDTNGDGDASVPARGNWGAVVLSGPGSRMRHVELRYGGFGRPAHLVVDGGGLTLENSASTNSVSDGLRIQNADPVLTSNQFVGNADAAASMDLASNPAIAGVLATGNGVNGLALDGGTLSEPAFWDDADITYWLTGDVTVGAGQTLTVGAGQVVKFGSFGVDLSVSGSLVARGAAGAPIVFTESRDDSAGGDTNGDGGASVPAPGNWGAVTLGGPANRIEHAEFRYGGFGQPAHLVVDGAEATIANSTFLRSVGAGLRLQNADPQLDSLVFTANAGAAASMNLASSPSILGVAASGNGTNALALDGGTIQTDRAWDDPDIVYWLTGDVTVAQGVTLTIGAGQVVKPAAFSVDLFVDGALVVDGTAADPVVFTESRDDTAGGDSNGDGAASAPAPGNWGRVEIRASTTGSTVRHADLRWGGFGGTGMVQAFGGPLLVERTMIRDGVGAGVLASGAQADVRVQSSVVVDNRGDGIRAAAGAVIAAANNSIVGNSRGAVASGSGTRLVLDNNAVTHQSTSGVVAESGAAVELGHNDVFNPGATRGNYDGLADATGTAGNISVDPRYQSLGERLLAPADNSPLVDAADGDAAPALDFAGNVRIDDPAVPDTGTGSPAYADIGAFERDRWTSRIDAPRHGGTVLLGDTLWFAGTGHASPSPPSFAWKLPGGKVSNVEDPGFVRLDKAGTHTVEFAAASADGTPDPQPGTIELNVVDDPGPHPDLVVTGVRLAGSLKLGAINRIDYTLRNDGAAPSPAGLTDALYLSADARLDATDTRLAARTRPTALAAGDGASAAFEFIINDAQVHAGLNHFIVAADDTWQSLDRRRLSNLRALPTLAAVTELVAGTPRLDRFSASDTGTYFRHVVADGNLIVDLDDLDDQGINELYISFGSLPTRSRYDYGAEGVGADRRLVVPSAFAGDWFVLVYADQVAGGGEYRIEASTHGVYADSVAPAYHGNAADAVLRIAGAGFVPGATVELVGPAGSFAATRTDLVSTRRVEAVFAAQSVPAGVYSLRITVPGGASSVIDDGFEMIDGGVTQLETNLVWPSQLGYHQLGTFYLEYKNAGELAMPSPLLSFVLEQQRREAAFLTLDASRLARGFWTSARPDGFSPSVQFLAHGGTPGVLEPGESGRVPIYYAGWQQPWDFSYPPFEAHVHIADVGDTDPVDWSVIRRDLRPADVDADAWDAVWQNFLADTGTTWGEFVDRLSESAQYLARLGHRVTDVTDLAAFDMLRADGAFQQELAASREASARTPAERPLTFDRTFLHGISDRYRQGIFGRGWRHDWDVSLVERADGTIEVNSPGTQRLFQPDVRGGYFQHGGMTLTRNAADGSFDLSDRDGAKQVFAAGGRLARVAGPGGHEIMPGYAAGRLVSLTNQNQHKVELFYNADGLVERVVDPQGNETTYEYDAAGEYLTAANYPDGSRVEYGYVTVGDGRTKHALAEVNIIGIQRRRFAYDGRGRLEQITIGDGLDAVSFAYGDAAELTVTRAGKFPLTYLYDHLGNAAAIRRGDGSVTTIDQSAGPVVRVAGASGSVAEMRAGARPGEFVFRDAGGGQSLHELDDRGALARFVDPAGAEISFTRDSAGRVTSARRADGSEVAYAWGPYGVEQLTNRRGQTAELDYDATGSLAERTVDGSVTRFVNNAAGQLEQIHAPHGDYSIDCQNQTCTVNYPGGQSLAYQFDAAGRIASLADHTGSTIAYTYSTDGVIEEVRRDGQLAVSYEHEHGVLQTETLGNGMTAGYEYNVRGQIDRLEHRDAGGQLVSWFDYAYDTSGRLESLETHRGQWTYEYDRLGQLVAAALDSSDASLADQAFTYEYDLRGNRIRTMAGGAETLYQSDALNQYTSVGGAKLAYDADGNLTRDTQGAAYEFDALNRLVRSEDASGVTTIAYGELGERTVTRNGAAVVQIVDPFDRGRLLAEFDAGGNVMRRYDHGYGLVAGHDAGGNAQFYTFDAMGNTAAVYDANAGSLNQYAYAPFGDALLAAESVANPFRFSGRFGARQDSAQLVFMQNRHYAPELGRFVSEDPMGLAGGTQLYAYARNRPTMLSDPTGLKPTDAFLEFIDFRRHYNEFVDDMSYRYENLRYRVDRTLQEHLDVRLENTFVTLGVDLFVVGGTIVIDRNGPHFTIGVGPALGAQVSVGSSNRPVSDGWMVAGGGYLGLGGQVSSNLDDQTTFEVGLGAGGGIQANYTWTGSTLLWCVTNPGDCADSIGSSVSNRAGQAWQAVSWLGRTVTSWTRAAADHLQPDRDARTCGCRVAVIASVDPNQKLAHGGYGPRHYVAPDDGLSYRIDFENDAQATAPAQVVMIDDPLSDRFDWSTFELLEVGFGDVRVAVPPGSRAIQSSVPVVIGGRALDVDVDIDLDLDTGRLRALFVTTDPQTGLPPEVQYGFLPPEDGSGRGQGFFTYLLKPRAGLASGTEIRNVATITFDFGETIATNQIDPHDPSQGTSPDREALVTIDADVPSSEVLPLPAVSPRRFTVAWSGDDVHSGVYRYDVYVSDNGAPPALWQAATQETSAEFTGEPGHVYAFYSVASDNVKLVEPSTGAPDTQTTVSATPWQNPSNPLDVDGNGAVVPLDVLFVINYINAHPGQTGLPADGSTPPPYYDVSGDNRISPLDVLLVINFLNARGGGEGEPPPVAHDPAADANAEPEFWDWSAWWLGAVDQVFRDWTTEGSRPRRAHVA